MTPATKQTELVMHTFVMSIQGILVLGQNASYFATEAEEKLLGATSVVMEHRFRLI